MTLGWLAAGAALAAAPEVDLWAPAKVGARVEAVTGALPGAVASPPTAPGALARGLLERPGLLALLHRAGVDEPLLDGLPAKGPTVVTASRGGAYAAYAFVDGRLWAAALTLPATAVAPTPDPFDPGRLSPLRDTLKALCPALRPTAKDDWGNDVAFAGSCRGGRGALFLDPERPDAAVQVVVWP